MFPIGHIATGFIVTKEILSLAKPALSSIEQQRLLWWGMFFSFSPDLDMFVSFMKTGSFMESNDVSHRQFISHVPLVWLIGGLAVFFLGLFSHNLFIEYLGILLWLCSWSHFALDSINHGIMWLWPWHKDTLALFNPGLKNNNLSKTFLSYWFEEVRFYITRFTASFVAEIAVVLLAIFIYLH